VRWEKDQPSRWRSRSLRNNWNVSAIRLR